MIPKGSDIKVVRTEQFDRYGLYVNGMLRAAGAADDVIQYLLHSFDRSFQHVVLSDEVIETFDGILPQHYESIDEVVEDLKNCDIFD
jgi:hypothetical protein